MDSLIIRKATPADAASLAGLYGVLGDDRAAETSLVERVFASQPAEGHSGIWLALDADQVVGTYQLFILQSLSHGGCCLAVAESVAVAADQQGKGIGRRLMLHAASLASAAGCYKLMLSSNLKRSQAHAFYDSLGFERHGYSFSLPLRASPPDA